MQEGQLNVNTIGNRLTVSLPNYPTPEKTEGEGITPKPLYQHPDEEELKGEPPVDKEKDGDKEIIRRKDNGKICGMTIHNWDQHEDANLMKFNDNENIVLDPPRR